MIPFSGGGATGYYSYSLRAFISYGFPLSYILVNASLRGRAKVCTCLSDDMYCPWGHSPRCLRQQSVPMPHFPALFTPYTDRTANGVRPYRKCRTRVPHMEYARTPNAIRSTNAVIKCGKCGTTPAQWLDKH